MKTPKRALAAVILSVAMTELAPVKLPGQSTTSNEAADAATLQKEACAKNLRQVYEAIQAYRADHQRLPDWLSDLVPKYLADTSALICPAARLGSKSMPLPGLADPKLTNSYVYEFCAGEAGAAYQSGRMKMRDLKSLQMAVVGGDTPILRCPLHGSWLNISFDGKLFDSPPAWEELYGSVVDADDLSPAKLLARFTNVTSQRLATPKPEREAVAQPREEPSALLDKLAPNFELDLLEGGSFELGAHKGKDVVILDFWATWCGPCRAALPGLVEISNEYQKKGVLLRAVDLREKADTVRAFLKTANLKLSVLMDEDGSVSDQYHVAGIPQTVIVGKDGAIQAIHIGYSPENKDRLRQELDALLSGKPLLRRKQE